MSETHESSSPPVAVLGLPYDGSSSFRRGPALAPHHIREALVSPSANMSTECGIDLASETRWSDVGDLDLPAHQDPTDAIRDGVGALLAEGKRVLCLGGDHWVSYGILKAYAQAHPGLTLLHLDAHGDLYDHLDGNRTSHACPFARIMEDGLVKRLVQVGVRTLTAHQREQAERFGVEIVEMRHWTGQVPALEGPLYLSLDLDVLDPAFAPGISHHEPGGMSTREVLRIVQSLEVPVVGADLVELNPLRDLQKMTAMVAAKLMKEMLARLLA